MNQAPYPAPIARERVVRMVTDMGERMGWDEARVEHEIARYQRKIRLRQWLKDMGVEPTEANRRAYIERMKRRYHDRIRQQRAQEGDPEA